VTEGGSLDAGAFTRSMRAVRDRCGAKPAVCDRCLEVCEVDGDELVCPSCGGRWAISMLAPCPRTATARVIDEDGAEDHLCASHAAVWRRLVTRSNPSH
jgi:hypothetical protein